jgi:hypothetical protein
MITEIEMLKRPKSLTETALEMIRIARKPNPAHRILPEAIMRRCPASLDFNNCTKFKVFMRKNKP